MRRARANPRRLSVRQYERGLTGEEKDEIKKRYEDAARQIALDAFYAYRKARRAGVLRPSLSPADVNAFAATMSQVGRDLFAIFTILKIWRHSLYMPWEIPAEIYEGEFGSAEQFRNSMEAVATILEMTIKAEATMILRPEYAQGRAFAGFSREKAAKIEQSVKSFDEELENLKSQDDIKDISNSAGTTNIWFRHVLNDHYFVESAKVARYIFDKGKITSLAPIVRIMRRVERKARVGEFGPDAALVAAHERYLKETEEQRAKLWEEASGRTLPQRPEPKPKRAKRRK